jgi:hypothetical protein
MHPAGEQLEALRQRIVALLDDTVSPKVNLERVLLLLQTRLARVHGYSLWMGRPGEPPTLEAGTPNAVDRRRPLRITISDQEQSYGHLELYLHDGADLSDGERALVEWAGQTMAPLARQYLGLDVPHTPRPG